MYIDSYLFIICSLFELIEKKSKNSFLVSFVSSPSTALPNNHFEIKLTQTALVSHCPTDKSLME